MPHWIRFAHQMCSGFGTLEGDAIRVHQGDMFEDPRPSPRWLPLAAVEVLPPTVPSNLIALWNNFHALAAKLNLPIPEEPLYFLKAGSSCLATGATIRRPRRYSGRVTYEGELGIVIGKVCREVSVEAAAACIFGYTCVNDVTAVDLINKDPTFAQWVRAKSFDGFTPFGPVIATGLDPHELTVRTILNGEERQNYSLGDIVFSPQELVSRISRDMTLLPGDIICCGTSLGIGTMKEPHNTVDVVIDGIGRLTSCFVQ